MRGTRRTRRARGNLSCVLLGVGPSGRVVRWLTELSRHEWSRELSTACELTRSKLWQQCGEFDEIRIPC